MPLRVRAVRPNPSIERTSKRLRLLAAAHVERYASQVKTRRVAAFLIAGSAFGALSAATVPATKTLWQDSSVLLPPPGERTVLGIWRIVTPLAPVTRTIERVGTKYYMVARVTGENGERIGGTHGTLLKRASSTLYRYPGTRSARYEIRKDGSLVGYNEEEKEPFMRAEPYPELWVK
jgi:hypothetical protein